MFISAFAHIKIYVEGACQIEIMGKGKKILIWSSVVGGSALLGILLYGVTRSKSDKLERATQLDKEMAELMKKIDRAKK